MRFANATPDGSGHGNGLILPFGGAIAVDDVGHFLSMGFAYSATTKTTTGVGGAFTVPTFHNIIYSVKSKSLVANRSAASINNRIA